MEADVHHAEAINDSSLRFNGRTVCQPATSAKAEVLKQLIRQVSEYCGRSDGGYLESANVSFRFISANCAHAQ